MITRDTTCHATLLSKQAGALSGVDVCNTVFEPSTPRSCSTRATRWTLASSPASEGQLERFWPANGSRSNLLDRMSGIATLTSRYVRAVAGTGVTILDTHKSTPDDARGKAAVHHATLAIAEILGVSPP